MITSPFEKKRLMVPRWRSLALTLRSLELASPERRNAASDRYVLSTQFRRRLEAWRMNPSLVTAAELVETSIVEGEEGEAVPAARSLLLPDFHATPLIKRQAALLLTRAGHVDEVPGVLRLAQQESAGIWRRRTRLHPHDSLAWVELARCQTILGQRELAKRSMMVALQLTPNNRHVLRSASRLFLHIDDPERAHAIILRSPATRTDPWLISAEISLSQIVGERPTLYKKGLSLLDQKNQIPRQITELAGAIATTELLDGSRRKAGRFFRQSIIDPNGNALAQAEWATPCYGSELVTNSRLAAADEASEARAFHLYREGRFKEVILACEGWASEEPFSIRPYEFSSGIAGMLDEYEMSDELGKRGLAIRPDAATLLNARAFAHASMGKVQEAEKILRRISIAEGEHQWYVTQANRGLLAFRTGNIGFGMTLYRNAIEGFRRKGNYHAATLAAIYFARESARANIPQARPLIAEARKEVDKTNAPDAKLVFATIKKITQLTAPAA
jgi:hypothetical protein